MPPKLDKEWQSQLEAMEKRIADNIDNLDKKITENLVQSNEKLMGDIKALVVSELKKARKELGEIKMEVQMVDKKTQKVEKKVTDLEKQVTMLKEENKIQNLKYEIKQRELQLRIRGLEEEEKEDVKDKILKIFSELLEKTTEELESQIELVYRLRPRNVEREGRTNDIIVNFSVRKLKEEIIKTGYENPIEYNGKKL